MAGIRGGAAVRMMRHERGGKSLVVACLPWFFLGALGAHRYYLGRESSGLTMLVLTLVSLLFGFVPLAAVGFLTLAVWSAIDGSLMPGMARDTS